MQVELNLNAEADMIAAAIIEGMNEMIEEPKPEEKPKALKKAQKPKDAPKESNKDKAAKAKPEKPAPVVFKGAAGEYELAADADAKALKAEADAAGKALKAIDKKDSDLLAHYLALGKFQSAAAKLFKSVKVYGLFLKAELPASNDLDPALRSNCKWLWEALNVANAEGSDILSVLQVNRIEDFKSKNPTVIRREYKALKEEAEKAKAAEELGVSVEEAEALEAKEAEAKAEAEKAKVLALIEEFAAAVVKKAKDKEEEAKADLLDVLSAALLGKKKEALELLDSLA